MFIVPLLRKGAFKTPSQPLQIAILVGCFCIIAASAFIVQRFDRATLRFLEGYWHPLLYSIRQQRTQYYRDRKINLEQQNQTLRQTEATRKTELKALKRIIETQGAVSLSDEERDRYHQLNEQLLTPKEQETLSRIRQQLRAMPIANTDLMPTRLGNILRSAERAPLHKYGLDAIICWSRLWMLLPDAVKKDLQEARTNLNNAARVWLWSILFCIWTFVSCWLLTTSKPSISTNNLTVLFLFLEVLVTIWQLILGSLSAIFAYNWALEAASTYGELIEAAFDLHRHLLYQSIRWNLPSDPVVEHRVGQELTQYLRRRS